MNGRFSHCNDFPGIWAHVLVVCFSYFLSSNQIQPFQNVDKILFEYFIYVIIVVFSVSSMITVPVNTSLYQTVVQQISDGSIQVRFREIEIKTIFLL